ncbi:response regulator transcription factor [Sulfurihydrogenibium subterraneum]|uniref:response regulator transcription factor n=1 Tax=Sulfurihydrogenibium subterraneum TaxID=171121 RepID=UPI00048D56B6|nr:response regulator transcription factor [Sulfurihydrogenibium subterraneum]
MKVLIIEDEKKLGKLIKKGLEEESFIVDLVYTGKEALDFITTQSYDVIILDLMLPDISGKDVLIKIRNSGIKTPVIVLTAKDEVKDKIELLDAGADDYITKPFDFDELLARIRAVVRRDKDIKSSVIRIGDLEIDLSKSTVKKSGELIKLSSKEYLLLRYFIFNKGKILTKDNLINAVYDLSFELNSNALEVLISRLRTKIEDENHKYIKSIRGLGYIFDEE